MWAEVKQKLSGEVLKKKTSSWSFASSAPPTWLGKGTTGVALKWHLGSMSGYLVLMMTMPNFQPWHPMTYGAVQLLLCTIHLPTSVLLSKREIEAYFVKANAFGIFLYSDLDSCLTRKPSLKGAPFDNLCITYFKPSAAHTYGRPFCLWHMSPYGFCLLLRLSQFHPNGGICNLAGWEYSEKLVCPVGQMRISELTQEHKAN